MISSTRVFKDGTAWPEVIGERYNLITLSLFTDETLEIKGSRTTFAVCSDSTDSIRWTIPRP
jgi:hypothetical protein